MAKVRKFFKTLFVFAFAGIVIFAMNFINNIKIFPQRNDTSDLIAQRNINETQIIELWNIETFEGGIIARSAWLNKTALAFEKKNHNIFILVKNLTFDELYNHLDRGEYPDILSFGGGLNMDSIADKMLPLNADKFKSVKGNLLASGTKDNRLLAISYMFSGYALMTIKDNISSPLTNSIFSSFNTIKTKKGEKNIYSLIYGGGGLTSPEFTLDLGSALNPLSIFDTSNDITSYEAYTHFLMGKANILAGTMRDIARLQNRENLGELSNLIIEPYTPKTDMISYVSVLEKTNKTKIAWALDFVDYLLSSEVQQTIKDVGLLSVTENIYDDGIYKALEEKYLNPNAKLLF